jgi:hypothetical protein
MLLKATDSLIVSGEILRHHLERNLALQTGVLGQIDFSHATKTTPGVDLVRPEGLAHQ